MDIRQYSFSNKIYMFVCWIRTKLFYPQLKVIRFTFDIRNQKNIKLGKRLSIGRMCRFEVSQENSRHNRICLSIGADTRIGDFVHISALESVIIGENCGIGPKCVITDVNHGDFSEEVAFDITIPYKQWPLHGKPVRIGNNVWLGGMVCVLPGVSIGDGCVVGALSIVTKSIPPYSMAVGNPAKIIKRYDPIRKGWYRTNDQGVFVK